jgi:hypothetical protein
MTEGVVSEVEASGILTIDLLDFKPKESSIGLDIADFLHLGLMLKEKEFKEKIIAFDWEVFSGKSVAIFCSSDAIVPSWAYMQLANSLTGIASHLDYCDVESLDLKIWQENIQNADLSVYQGEKVVVRAHQSIHPSLYVLITQKLKGVAKTIMYGEAGLPKVITKN